jgi:hypothetical protein
MPETTPNTDAATTRGRKRPAHDDGRVARDDTPDAATQHQNVLSQVREVKAMMACIYSFLSVKERVRLGGVDKKFREDEERGSVEGTYGSDDKNIKQALEAVCDFLSYEGSPDTVFVHRTLVRDSPACWNLPTLSPIWWKEQFPELFDSTWFTKTKGYDLETMRQSGRLPETKLKAFQLVHENFCKNMTNLARLTAAVDRLPSASPFNALFELMEENGIDTENFLNAKQPLSFHRTMGYNLHYYENTTVSSWPRNRTFLHHLRPGRKFIFRDSNGNPLQKVLRSCMSCRKVRDTVQDSSCVLCVQTIFQCHDWSEERTCSSPTCKITACKCNFVDCSFPRCSNRMCWTNGHTIQFRCCALLVDDSAGVIVGHAGRYCAEHKPEGAVHYVPFFSQQMAC